MLLSGGSRRRAFREWHAGRPFVGAVLVVLAGLELLLSGPIDLGAFADTFGVEGIPDMQLAIGIEGVQAIVLPLALILLGLLSMWQPVHRIFYGVIILVISVYTLSGVNLGGWFVGFLLGVIGGVVIVSWAPREQAAAAPVPSDDDVPGDRDPTVPAKSAAVVLGVVLALGGLQPMSVAAAEADCWDPIEWIDWVDCDEASPSPSPSGSGPASSSPSPSRGGATDDPAGDVVDDVTDGVGDVVDGVTGGGDAAGGAGDGTDGGAKDDGTDKASGEKAAEIFSDDPSAEGLSVGYVCDGEKKSVTLPMLPAGEDNTHTFSLPADLRTSDLEISGIRSIELVSVPVTHEAERRDVLKIVADHVKTPGFWLKTYAYDTADGKPTTAGTDTSAGYVSMDGSATMYISGVNLGCPDFGKIAEEPPATIVAWLLALSDAQIDLVGATSDVQTWSGFREQVWGDPERPIGEGPEAGMP
ncbi:DUF6114 domain-containing protein [Myceligenerans crystallogenes]|uniref:Uncharacterized protein n=1 Tax=Myceligenerans crystallogenes TaxID=316335 RepID=A0ABP4ZG63_9MICO